MKKNKNNEQEFKPAELQQDLYNSAKAIGIPEGSAKEIARRVTRNVVEWVEQRSIITSDDLNRKIAKEAQKYNDDLAYVYQIRGTII